MNIQATLVKIRNTEMLLSAMRLDIADAWRDVGSMLREVRQSRRLTQQQAAALIAKDASVVLRWEKGYAVDATEVMDYLSKLETN